MDISGFGGVRPGLSSYLPGQNPNALIRGSAIDQAGGGLWRQPQESVDLLNRLRGVGERAGGIERGGASAKPPVTSPGSAPATALSQAISSAFALIKDDIADMFKTLGMSDEQAKEATGSLVASMEKAATTADAFHFNFSRAVARYARSDFAYSGSGGAVAGTSESASLNVKSLDIYVNNKTGEFSINYAQASVSVEKTAIVATSGANTANLPGPFEGLSFGSGSEESGISSFIERMLQTTAGHFAANEKEEGDRKPAGPGGPTPLSQQIFQAAEAAITAFEPDVADPNGGSDRFSRLKLDLSVPLGLLQRDAQGPIFKDLGGHRSVLQAPKQAGIDVDV